MVRCYEKPLRSQSDSEALVSATLIEMAEDRQQTTGESSGIFNRLKKAIRLDSRSTPQPLDEAAKLRAKYTRFRILVIGRANAGKTTLLKRVCNTTEEPSIYDEDKNLVSYWLVVVSALIISSPTARTNLEGAGSVILAPILD